MQNTRNTQIYDFWILLGRTYRLIAQAEAKELGEYDISREQNYILFIIHTLGDRATPSEISKHTYRKQNSVTELLNRMETNGLVVKTRKLVKKSRINVRLSKKGLATYHKTSKIESINKIVSTLSRDELETLSSCLKKLKDSAVYEISFNGKKLVPPSQLIANMTEDGIS